MEFPPRCAFLMTNKLDQEHYIYEKTVELCDMHVHFWIFDVDFLINTAFASKTFLGQKVCLSFWFLIRAK